MQLSKKNKKTLIIIGLTIITISIILLIILLLSCKQDKKQKPSYLIANDTKYSIDTSGNFCTDRQYNGTFDFTDLEGNEQSIDRDQITEIHLTDLKKIKKAPDSYLKYTCSLMINLTVVDIQIPTTITSVGIEFCGAMFYSCYALRSLPDTFNLPKKINNNAETNFCAFMFDNCQSLTSLPSNFNLPQGITSTGDDFCESMFQNCSSLELLPSQFNIPQRITSVGDNFCKNMFYDCSLVSLPSNFNLPQNIISVGNYFCNSMFNGCIRLKNDNANKKVTITIPNPSIKGEGFCDDMFYDCTGLDHSSWSWWPTPLAGSTITINSN